MLNTFMYIIVKLQKLQKKHYLNKFILKFQS